MYFGETIHKQGESRQLLLRQAGAFLEVDTAFVSKLERDERNASRVKVIKLAEFLETPPDHLWLADNISDTIKNNMKGEDALKLSLENYRKK